MDNFLSSSAIKRSQELQTFYRLNGAIYCFTTDSLNLNQGVNYSKSVFSYVIPNEFSVDIDTQSDFDFTEYLLQK